MDEQELTGVLAGYAAGLTADRLGDDAVRAVRRCVLDWLGVAQVGSGTTAAAIARDHALDQGGRADASLIGADGDLPAASAAMANAVAGHVLDYDDKHFDIPGHPSAVAVPAVLATAEACAASGAEFVVGIVAAVEVMCRVGRLVGQAHYDAGWHSTSTVGAIGAAAGASRVLGLDARRTAVALGLAATRAGGLKGTFGTSAKAFNVGSAASTGVLAAQFAARGFDGPTDLLTARQGFGPTYAVGPDDRAARDGLGAHPAVCDVRPKFHAACYATHPLIECALRVRSRLGSQEVEAVEIRIPRSALGMCVIPHPATAVEAQFSVSHVVAMALHGVDTADVASFSARSCVDPDLSALRERTTVTVAEYLKPGAGELVVTTAVRPPVHESVNLRDEPIPEPAVQDRVEAKFRALTAGHLRPDQQESIVAAVRGLTVSPDVRGLTALTRAREPAGSRR